MALQVVREEEYNRLPMWYTIETRTTIDIDTWLYSMRVPIYEYGYIKIGYLYMNLVIY